MTDAATSTGAALFAALDGNIGTPVFQHVPQDTDPPVTIIGEHRETAPFGKGDPDRRIDVDILTIFQGEANKPVTEWQAQIVAILDGAALSHSGFLIRPTLSSKQCELLEDGVTYVGTTTFTVLALVA